MPLRLSAILIALTTGLLAAGQAQAQKIKADDEEREIVVPGDRPMKPSEVKRQARQITADGNLRRQPLARFEEPVCPGVIGLPFDLASPMIMRVRAVAETVGIDTAEASDCRPNVIIAFTGDGKADLAELAERDVSMISGLSYWDRKKLLKEDGPVRAFAMIGTTSNTGMRGGGGFGSFETTIASRLVLSVRRDIETAVVLIDAEAADGKTVTQLADYAAMRTFARTKPPKSDTYYGTILQLFEDIEPLPDQITTFDIAYLQAVYSGAPNRKGMTKLKKVSQSMAKETKDSAAE